MAHPPDAAQVISRSIDEYNVEEFIDQDFADIAAAKIIADLEFHNFKIIKLEPKR